MKKMKKKVIFSFNCASCSKSWALSNKVNSSLGVVVTLRVGSFSGKIVIPTLRTGSNSSSRNLFLSEEQYKNGAKHSPLSFHLEAPFWPSGLFFANLDFFDFKADFRIEYIS